MKPHPDDTALLDATTWTDGACCRCRKSRPVAPASGEPTCRDCLAYALHLDRGCGEPLKTLTVAAGVAQ
jgi:hypothetical protein